MEKLNEPLLGGSNPKRQNPLLNSAILGAAMFFILMLEYDNQYNITKIQLFFINCLSFVAILISSLLITKLREKISILISTFIFLIVFIINFNFPSVSTISYIIQPFASNLLWIAAGTYIMTISDKCNIGKNFGLFFSVTSFLDGILSVSNVNIYNNDSKVYQLIYFLFMVIAVVLISLLKNPCCEQNENITVTGTDPQSLFNSIAYPMGLWADKKFLFLAPAIAFLGIVSILYPFGFFDTASSGFEYSESVFVGINFLGAVAPILFGFLFDRFEKKFLFFSIATIGVIGAVLNIVFAYTTCCTQGQIDLAYASLIFNTITQYGLKVLVFSLLGSIYLDCRSLSANVCYQLLSTLAYLFIDLIFSFVSVTACFYISLLVLILACIGIFKFLSSSYDQEQQLV
ncbi:hypothetical protein ACTFIW_000299 [Dictyostelium discoideum]